MKNNKILDKKNSISLIDFITKRVNNKNHAYTVELVQRLKKHFDSSKANIIVMNFHDKSMGLAERFYCEIVPCANHICDAVRKSPPQSNKSKFLGYSILVYAAMQNNLIEIDSEEKFTDAIIAAEEYHEQTLNCTVDDFELKCLSNETSQHLLEKSLDYEKYLFPELDENDLRIDFMKQAKSKLCEIDTKYILNQTEWKEFFLNNMHIV